MPLWWADQDILQEDHPHVSRLYLSVLKPQIVYVGTITGSPDPFATGITVSDVSGNIANIIEGMTIFVGTTAGDDDVDDGRRRYRSRAGQVLKVDENSIIWTDGMFITVIENWELWPVFPWITPDGPPFVFYKDRDIAYTDQNENVDPVAIIRHNHAAKFLDGPTVSFNLIATDSYAVANGASISTYLWECDYGVIGNSAAGSTTITFDTPNKNGYWVHLTVTDSNGKSHTTRRVRFVHTRTGTHAPHYDFQAVNPPTGDWATGGWRATFEVRDEAGIDNFPDKSLCLFWGEEFYNGVLRSNIGKNSSVQIAGYIRGDTITTNTTGDDYVRFQVTTIHDLMKRHKMFSVSLEDKSNPNKWYEYSANGNGLTVSGAVHHFWHWHSTLLDITNVLLPVATDTVRFPACDDFVNGDLYSMAENFAFSHGIFSHVCCNKLGEVYMEVDANMLGTTGRADLTWAMFIEERDRRGDPILNIIRDTERTAAYATLDGVTYDGATTTPLIAVAPSDVPYVDGGSELVLERQALEDLPDAVSKVGRALAIVNSVFKQFPVQFAGNYSFIDLVPQEWFLITIEADETKRGIAVTDLKMLPRLITNAYDPSLGVMQTNVVFDPEASGQDGIEGNYPSDLEDPPEPLPLSLVDGALVTFDSVNGCHVRSSWTEKNGILAGADIQDQYGGKDSWWAINQGSVDIDDAILWKCDVGAIFRTTDLGATWTDMTPATGPDSYDPTTLTYIAYQGNDFYNYEHIFLARVLDSGTWYSWILYTGDNGANWSWKGTGSEHDFSADSFGPEQNVGDDCFWAFCGQFNYSSLRAIAVLSSSKVVFLREYIDMCDEVTPLKIECAVGDISGDTITTGPWYRTNPLCCRGGTDFDYPMHYKIVEMTSNNFLLIQTYHQDGGIFEAWVVAGTVSGTVISYGTAVRVESQPENWYSDTGIVRLTDTLAVVGTNNYGMLDFYVVSVIGNVVSPGSTQPFTDNSGDGLQLCRLSDTQLVACYDDYNGPGGGDDVLYARVGTVSGSSIAWGDEYQFSVGAVGERYVYDLDCIGLEDGYRFVVVWGETYKVGGQDSQYSRVGVVSMGSVITFGLQDHFVVEPTHNVLHTSLDVINSNSVLLYYAILHDSQAKFVYGEVKETTIVWSLPFDNESGQSEWGSTRLLSSAKAITYFWQGDDQAEGYIFNFTMPYNDESKALGMSIGRGTGDRVYVTICDDTELLLQRYKISTLALEVEASMGNATIAQVDAETWTAYPLALQNFNFWDYDCIVYGRMNDPLGGGVSQMLITIDGGVSGTDIENGWGIDICSAAREDFLGIIYAFRNKVNGSQLYVGYPNLVYVGDVPLRMNHGAMHITIDHYVIIAGRVANGGKLVLYSPVPYSTWTDVTEDHPINGNVKALAIV